MKVMVNSIVNSNASLCGFVIPQFAGSKDLQLLRGVFMDIRKIHNLNLIPKIFLPDNWILV